MKKIYALCMATMLTAVAMAQTVTIGTDVSTTPSGSTYRSPWSPLYGYSYVQTIYLQSEINTAGTITSLTYNYSGTSLENSDVVTVYMGTVARSAFASTSDWEPVGNLTQVFQGQVSYTSLPGTVTINLTTPFVYANNANLIIAVDEDVPGYSEGSSFYATEMGTGNTRTIYFNDDDAENNPDPSAPPTADGIRTKVGNIQITFGGLPVTLGDFSGEVSGAVNKLSWMTHSEQKNKGFELQRSADGNSFTTIDFVNSKAHSGISNAALTYSFVDNKRLRGTNYYRLKQVDLDGHFTYSKVVMLKGVAKTLALNVVYPNPTKNTLNVILTSASTDKATVYITNALGKTVYAGKHSIAGGDNKLEINASAFAPGIYTIKAVYEGTRESAVAKFVKQ